MQRREDKRLLPLMIGAFLLIVLVVFGIGSGLSAVQWMMLPLGIVLGVLAAIIIFGRRVQRSVYSQGRGPDRAPRRWALDNMRGKWRVTPGVAGHRRTSTPCTG